MPIVVKWSQNLIVRLPTTTNTLVCIELATLIVATAMLPSYLMAGMSTGSLLQVNRLQYVPLKPDKIQSIIPPVAHYNAVDLAIIYIYFLNAEPIMQVSQNNYNGEPSYSHH